MATVHAEVLTHSVIPHGVTMTATQAGPLQILSVTRRSGIATGILPVEAPTRLGIPHGVTVMAIHPVPLQIPSGTLHIGIAMAIRRGVVPTRLGILHVGNNLTKWTGTSIVKIIL